MDLVLEYWPMIAFALGLGLAAGGWAIRMGLVSKKDLNEIHGELDEAIAGEAEERARLTVRVQRIESSIEHLPTTDVVHRLALQMTELAGKIEQLSTRFDGFDALQDELKHQVRVMDDFLRRVKN